MSVLENPKFHKPLTIIYNPNTSSSTGVAQMTQRHNQNRAKFKMRLSTLARRIPEPPLGFDTITDMDPEFYAIVEGRPVGNDRRLRLELYVEEMKKSASARLQTGLINDEALRCKTISTDELREYEETRKAHDECADLFEEMLKESDRKAASILDSAKRSQDELAVKKKQCDELDVELGEVVRKIYEVEERSRFAKIYQNFLHYVSPLSWCQDRDILPLKIHHGQMFSGLSFVENISSPERAIENFKSNFSDSPAPQLYFTEPDQLVKILRNAEHQALTYWSNSEAFSENLKQQKTDADRLRDSINKQLTELAESINHIQEEINAENNRKTRLRDKVTNLLSTHFRNAVSSEDCLTMKVSVDHIHEKVVIPDVTFDTFDMMKNLELEYELNMIKLDNINQEAVQTEKKYSHEEDIKIMKVAKEASMKLKNLEKLFKLSAQY